MAERVQLASALTGGDFSASAGGLLIYSAGEAGLTLAWFDRNGNRLSKLGDLREFRVMHFSPDRKNVAVRILDPGAANSKGDIWIFDVTRGVRTRFTFGPAGEVAAIWSPDGRTIVFGSDRSGHSDLYRKASDGSGSEELLYADNRDKYPTSWSPDGKFLLYSASDPKATLGDIWALPLTPDKPGAPLKPFPFVQTAFNEYNAQFSPDGRWVTYQCNETGRTEVYFTPFPGPGGKRQVSLAGGALARWRRDGKEIFFIAPDQKLMAAEVSAKGVALEIGDVHPLFGPLTTGWGFSYDVSLDGQKFLAVVPPEQSGAEQLTVVQNWTAGLKK
jgi:Tol biopolymer transport system component